MLESDHLAASIIAATGVALLFLPFVLMGTLTLPRLGCGLLYIYLTAFVLSLLTLGVGLLIGATYLKHYFEGKRLEGLEWLLSAFVAAALLFVAHRLLGLSVNRVFQSTMRWFVQATFKGRVGATPPPGATNSPAYLAYRAVWDDAYGGDVTYGPVNGWGLKASCKRLRRIKHNH